MLDVRGTVDDELVKRLGLGYLLETLASVTRLLGVEVRVGRGQRDVRVR